MKFQLEVIDEDLFDEVEPLLKKNKEEINYWDTPLRFNRDTYIYADAAKAYRGYSVRDEDNKIVGYIGYWIINSVHDLETTQASQDLFYIENEYRKGWTAFKLLRFSEKELKEKERVTFILQQSSTSKPIGPLFNKLGYEKVSTVYKKEI